MIQNFFAHGRKKSTLLVFTGWTFAFFSILLIICPLPRHTNSNVGIFPWGGDKVMKCYEVTGTALTKKRLSVLDGLSLVTLRDNSGNSLVAVDLLGAQIGDHVVVSASGAQVLLGTNLPVDALILCVLDTDNATSASR